MQYELLHVVPKFLPIGMDPAERPMQNVLYYENKIKFTIRTQPIGQNLHSRKLYILTKYSKNKSRLLWTF
jgi:hypothetical protein